MFEKEDTKEIDLSVKELLNDSFFLDIITETIRTIDNDYIKKYLGDYLLFYGAIFTEEVIQAGAGDLKSVSAENLKIIKELRTKNLKYSPTINSKHIIKKVKDMGIDFDYYVFDTVITINGNNTLYDINLRTWEYQNIDKDYFSKLDNIACTGSSWNKKILLSNIPILESYKKVIVLLIKEKLKKYDFKYKAYASSKLLNTNIKVEEKLYIAQRYGLYKTIEFINELLEDIPLIDAGILELDVKKFLRKNKAILFGILWNDYNNTKMGIIENIFKKNNEIIPKDFYPINTKIRNNLHYSKINIIEDKENNLFDIYEKEYMKNISVVFNENLNVKFGFGYNIALYLAKLQFEKENKDNLNKK